MKKKTKIIIACIVVIVTILALSLPVLAVTEAQVRNRVAQTSSAAVSGNIFIWFLCAIAFLKISHKMDSFMSSLGINVGNTGGNMLAEALIVARGVGMGKQLAGGGGSGGGGGQGLSSSRGSGATGGFMAGGLAGVASRRFHQSAVSSATSTATNKGGNAITRNAYNNSVASGGKFANNIIGGVAHGNINQMGSISGDKASAALASYKGEVGKADVSSYKDVEIGGGRIMGTEISPDKSTSIPFGMYSTEQYMPPEKGDFDTIKTADGAQWYRQYAMDAVERTPYATDDGGVGYNKAIVQKLPPIPRRKDKV